MNTNLKSISLEKMDELIEKAWKIKQEAKELADQKTEKEKELQKINKEILEQLEASDKTSYDAKSCKAVRVSKFTVSIPKDPDEKAKFFSYLKKRDLFENMATVNHNTLNSFYTQELEEAERQGNLDFEIPGLGEPKLQEYLTFRKR